MKNDDNVLKSRRNFLVSSLSLAAASILTPIITNAKDLVDAPNQLNSHNDILDNSQIKDGLAHPISYIPETNFAKERGIALGGGGIYLLSFYCGYFHGLKRAGVDLSEADIVVGTSAGSIAGAMLMGGFLWKIMSKLDILSFLPKLFALILPSSTPNISQERAKKLLLQYNTADVENIQAIGRAAMAALNNALDFNKYYKSVHKLIGTDTWLSDALYITANDCYTGERIIISKEDNVPVYVACAASSSLPGKTGPTWVKDRLCMDGGICQTSTHCDIIKGVKKALVISLGDGTKTEITQGLRISALPDTLNQEIKMLQDQGAEVFHIIAGLLPGISKVDNIMDPKWIKPMLKYGYQRAAEDAEKMRVFWS